MPAPWKAAQAEGQKTGRSHIVANVRMAVEVNEMAVIVSGVDMMDATEVDMMGVTEVNVMNEIAAERHQQ